MQECWYIWTLSPWAEGIESDQNSIYWTEKGDMAEYSTQNIF